MRKLFIILFLLPLFANSQTLVDTTIDGYNAVIWRPAAYWVNGNADSSIQCIVFSYGAGETAASYTTLRTIGGPIAYLTGGWDGGVVLGNGTHYPIMIGLRIPIAFPTAGQPLAKLDAIRAAFKIKKTNLHTGGFSAGGYAYKIMATEDDYDNTAPYGPFTYADAFKSIVDVQGVQPDDNSDWLNKIKNFARNNNGGGKYIGFWGTGDASRYIPEAADAMNSVVSGSAWYTSYAVGHTWNPGVAKIFGYPNGTAPDNWNINGLIQNAYQWMLRQGDTTIYSGNIIPTVSAGSDSTFTFVKSSTTLTGTATDADGTITSTLWTKQSGPTCTITNTGNLTTTVTGMSYGTYVFRLTATDDEDSTNYDEVTVNNGIPCNPASPVTYTLSRSGSPGSYEIYITNATTYPWKGGDTLLIQAGTYSVIEIDSFGGDPCKNIYIRNVGGQVIVDGPMRFGKDVHYVTIEGKDSAGIRYGFKCTSFSFGRVSHWTMRRIECGPNPSGVGIYGKQAPDTTNSATIYPNYVNRKITIDSCYVHNVEGEGLYIGDTAPDFDPYEGAIPQRGDSTTISNNIVDSCGWDGIQLSNSRDGCLIFGNTVTNFGLNDFDSQRAGIITGGNTNSKVYNNTVSNGTGNGIQVFGYGQIEVYNNTITNVGNTVNHVNGEESIFGAAYLNLIETNPAQYVWIHDNQINYPKVWGAIRFNDDDENADTALLENNNFCFSSNPGVDWKTNYIFIAQGYTDTNNILSCVSAMYRGFKLNGRRIKF